MTLTTPLAGCSPFNLICKATHAAAASAFQSVVDAMTSSAGEMLRTLMSFWVRVNLPDLASPSGVTFWVNSHLSWLVSAAAVFSVLVGAGRLALSRRAEHGYDVARMLVRTMVTAVVAVPVVSLLAAGGDTFAHWILKNADVNSLATLKLAALAPGTVLIGDLVIILTSLFQMAIMVMRGAVVAILVGLLPVTAATTNTAVGKASFAKLCGWLGSFLLIKPAAALIYAGGLQLEAQTSAQAELSGIFVLGLAVIALPVLIKMLVPAAGAIGNSGGGAMTLAAAGAAATGAIALTGGAGAAGAARAGGGTGVAARATGSGGSTGGTATGSTGSGGGGGGGISPSGSGGGGSGSGSGGTGTDAGGGAGGGSGGTGTEAGGGAGAGSGSTGSGAGIGAGSASTSGGTGGGAAAAGTGGGGSPPGSAPAAGSSSAPGSPSGPAPTAGGGTGGGASPGARSGSWGGGRAPMNPWVLSARQVADNARAAAQAGEPEPGLNISDNRGGR